MKLQIQAINFDADQKLLQFTQKKMDKLDTFFDRIIDGEVYLKVETNDEKGNKSVHLQVHLAAKQDLNVKEQAESFEEAIDTACEVMARKLKRLKEKMNEF